MASDIPTVVQDASLNRRDRAVRIADGLADGLAENEAARDRGAADPAHREVGPDRLEAALVLAGRDAGELDLKRPSKLVSRPRRYLNRRKSEKVPASLLDLLLQHYDELSRLVALAPGGGDGPASRRQSDEVPGLKTATPSRS